MKLRFTLVLSIIGLMVFLSAMIGCNDSGSKSKSNDAKSDSKELVVYSGRKENLVKPIIKMFEEKTGIKVKLLASDASQLANKIIAEKNNPQADIYISKDGGGMDFLSDKGALQSYKSDKTDRVAENFKAKDGTWFGASIRSRVIMYNTDLVKKEDTPKSVFDLADAKWKGKFGIVGSSNESIVSNITAIRWLKGEKFTEDFLMKMLANKPVIMEGHTEVSKAVGAGELSLGWVNHYYFHQIKHEGAPVDVIYPDQGKDDIGTMVNVAGVGIIKNARNEKNAQAFIDFVLSDEAQEKFGSANYELPVIDGVDAGEAKPLKDFKVADVKLGDLGEELNNTMDLLEKVKM